MIMNNKTMVWLLTLVFLLAACADTKSRDIKMLDNKHFEEMFKNNTIGDRGIMMPKDENFDIFALGKQAVPLLKNQKDDGIAMFPPANKDEKRFIIKLEVEQDKEYKVELTGGIRRVADCNTNYINGIFSLKSLSGWGYGYYMFKELKGGMATTMMACPSPAQEKLLKSVPTVVNYNKKLPLIIYMPKGYELYYRVYTSDSLHLAQ